MICNAPITTWQKGDEVEGFYLLSDAALKTSNAGKPFLSANLRDGASAIALKAWDYAGPIGEQDNGAVVKVRGRVQDYKGTLQLVADRLRLAEPTDDYDLGTIVPTAPIDREAAWQQVLSLVDTMADPDFQAVAREVLRRHEAAFRAIPAAKSYVPSWQFKRNASLSRSAGRAKRSGFAACSADTIYFMSRRFITKAL